MHHTTIWHVQQESRLGIEDAREKCNRLCYHLTPDSGFVEREKDLDPYTRKQFNYNKQTGVRVLGLVPDSPATEAGLQVDDIIISYQGEPVSSMRRISFLTSQPSS